jgi:alginate O-acetyltransferase complex protein AlgI
MSLTSLAFVGFAALSIMLLRILPGGGWRQATLLCLDAAFLYSQSAALLPLVPLIGFVLLGYVAVIVAEKRRTRHGLGLLVLGLVAIFVWLKRYPLVSSLPTFGFAFTVVGLSYMLFRILHIVIDVGQGSLNRPRFVTYLNYVFNFLCLLSGPIARLEEFEPQLRVRPPLPTWREVDAAAQRILRGYVMVTVLAAIATNFVNLLKPEFSAALTQGDFPHGVRVYALLAGTYFFNLYVNFSGYMEIVIGVGALAGLTLPENFNLPFLSKNFLDLWSRWHMTLSNWFKFYLFNAVLKALGERFGTRSNMAYLGAIAFFVTFLVMGIWHGTTYIFFLYGLFLGAGAIVNRLWQIWAPQWLGKNNYKILQQRQWYFQLSRAATLCYLAVACTAFWITDQQAAALIQPTGLAIFLVGYVALVAAATMAGFAWDGINAFFRERLFARWTPMSGEQSGGVEMRRARKVLLISLLAVALASLVVALVSLDLTGILSGSSRARKFTMLALMAGACAAILIGVGRIEPAVARWRDAAFPRRGQDAAAVWLGARALLVINLVLLMVSSIPEFIYKAF